MLQITARDPQKAFDWSCGNRGLKRVGDLEEHIEAPLDDETRPWRGHHGLEALGIVKNSALSSSYLLLKE